MLIAMQDTSTATQNDPFARLENLVLQAKTQIQNATPRAVKNQSRTLGLDFEDQSMRQAFLDGLRVSGGLDQETIQQHSLDPAKVAALLDLE